MKHLQLVPASLIVAFMSACATHKCELKQDGTSISEESRLVVLIVSRSTSESDWKSAVAMYHPTPSEPPEFWSRIAADPQTGQAQRHLALLELIRRNVREGSSIEDLRRVLNYVCKPSEIDVGNRMEWIAGYVPINLGPSDSCFTFLLPNAAGLPKTRFYVQVKSDVQAAAIRNGLHETNENTPGTAIELTGMVLVFEHADLEQSSDHVIF